MAPPAELVGGGPRRSPLHHRVAAAAIDWDTSGRDPTELYHGTRLEAALDWSTTHPSEAIHSSASFSMAADAAHDHELRTARRAARRLRSLAVGLAVLLIVTLVAGTVALVQQHNADQQAARATRSAALARSTQLATLARTLPATQTDLALLLGVEGRRLHPSITTDGGLETAITHRPPHLERVLHFDTLRGVRDRVGRRPAPRRAGHRRRSGIRPTSR